MTTQAPKFKFGLPTAENQDLYMSDIQHCILNLLNFWYDDLISDEEINFITWLNDMDKKRTNWTRRIEHRVLTERKEIVDQFNKEFQEYRNHIRWLKIEADYKIKQILADFEDEEIDMVNPSHFDEEAIKASWIRRIQDGHYLTEQTNIFLKKWISKEVRNVLEAPNSLK